MPALSTIVRRAVRRATALERKLRNTLDIAYQFGGSISAGSLSGPARLSGVAGISPDVMAELKPKLILQLQAVVPERRHHRRRQSVSSAPGRPPVP